MFENILVIENDAQVRKYMGSFLQNCKYRCTLTDKGRIGLNLFLENPPDLAVLDMELGDGSSMAVLHRIRREAQTPVIATAFQCSAPDHLPIEVLDAGADDFILKPFNEREFLARIRARLRRAVPPGRAEEEANVFRMDYLTVDFDKIRVLVHGQSVHLTPTEYQMLCVLIANRGRLITYAQIGWELWGKNFEVNIKKIRVHMSAVRQKIGDSSRSPRFIFNIEGSGYTFAEE